MMDRPAAPSPIPTLETARLVLRGHRLDDFDDALALWSDPRVVRHIGGRALSGEDVWVRILRYAGHWMHLGFGYWAVTERETGRFVGEVGLASLRREITPSLEGVPESGWVLAPWAHGRGLATEAVLAVLGWHDARSAGGSTVCIIDPDNAPSLRVAAKCGYRELARTSYKGEPTTVFER
jgi:RimJ/RimL family protein N-acetyltransferase